jgi:hypothetical protein
MARHFGIQNWARQNLPTLRLTLSSATALAPKLPFGFVYGSQMQAKRPPSI